MQNKNYAIYVYVYMYLENLLTFPFSSTGADKKCTSSLGRALQKLHELFLIYMLLSIFFLKLEYTVTFEWPIYGEAAFLHV